MILDSDKIDKLNTLMELSEKWDEIFKLHQETKKVEDLMFSRT